MKTNMINTNSVIKSICAVVMLLGMSVSAWGTAASLPIDYTFSGGNNSLPTGVTLDGTGSDYGDTHSPYIIKFDGDGDYLQVETDSPARSISFGVKMVGGSSTSYFQLQGSVDGSSYADIEKFTISGSQYDIVINSTSVSINTSYRFFKFVFDKGSNVGFGTLTITKGNSSAYKVTFNAEGGTCATSSLTEENANDGVELPAASPSATMASMGWGFYGWAESAVSSPTTTAPTIVGKAGDTYYPSSATTLHAVFAKGEFTKITSESQITSGGKYLIAGWYNSQIHMMTSTYIHTDDYYMKEKVVSEYTSGKIRAIDIDGTWRYTITGSSNAYFIQDVVHNSNNYIDTYYTNWYNCSYTSTHSYKIVFDGGTCYIKNNQGTYPYLVLFAKGDFGTVSSVWADMLLYKETTECMFASNPKTVKVVASPAAGGIVDFYLTSTTEEVFSDEYNDIAEAAANDGYEFLRWETSNATNAKFSDGSAYTLTTSTDDNPEFKATGDATLTAYFYKQSAVGYTLTGLTKTSGPDLITASVDAADIVWVFSVSDHYRTTPLTCSVTMGGSPLTSGTDYTWNESTKTLTIPAATDITGDLVITISAEHTEYTKYAFSCAELTLTPVLATAGTPIFITSAASKTVRSQDKIQITGSGLTPSTTLTFALSDPSLATKFAIKKADGTALATDASGAIEEDAYIFYTPGSGDTDDGLDKLEWITASVSGAKPITKKLDQDIIGRHLPADFVIAAKKDGKWYALPSNMESTSTPAPSEIAVDDIDKPSIAYTAASNIYGLAGPTASNISGGNGQYIRLTMSIEDGNDPAGPAPLFGMATSNIGKSGNSKATSDLSAGNWWSLTQTNTSISNPQDAKYIVKCANNSNALKLYKTSNVWGQYAYGADVAISELRLIPASSVVFTEAEIVAWGQHNAIVEVDRANAGGTGVAAAKVKAKLNGEESSLITLTETGTSKGSATKYDYTVAFGYVIDFAANEGQMLTLEWYNSSDVMIAVSNIIVPTIVASDITINKTNYSLKSAWNTEVHVLPNVTVTVDASAYDNSDVTIKELNIYPGATVKVTTGTLKATTLVMRNGWDRLNGEKRYDVARLQIKETANLTHTNAYLDWYIDNDQYYPLAVPFPVTVSGIHYLNTNRAMTIGGYDGTIRLRYYDGANRAEGKMGNWKYYGADGSLAVPETLVPSMGYAMAAKRPGGKAFSIVRMPMTFDNAWTTGGEHGSATVDATPLCKDTVRVYAYGNAKTAENNKGWNLIGNPYMAVFHGDDNEAGIYGKLLAVTNKDDEKAEKVRYVTLPNSSFTDYEQVNFKDTLLQPSSSFLIQAKDTCRLEFSSSKIDIPSAPARYTATPTAASEQEAYIRLTGAGEKDQMGLIIGEDYTAAYETNADLAKMHGELNTLKTYMVYDSVDMAYLAINEELAKEWIPVVVRIPENGEYTYSLRTTSVVNELEGIYLIDYQTNTVTNLIENNYSFTSEAGIIEGRFSINVIAGQRETPTGIDAINAGGDINSDKPFKFIYHDKVYIWINGVIYDTTGKRVK